MFCFGWPLASTSMCRNSSLICQRRHHQPDANAPLEGRLPAPDADRLGGGEQGELVADSCGGTFGVADGRPASILTPQYDSRKAGMSTLTQPCDHCSAPAAWLITDGHEDFYACSRHLPEAALEATAGGSEVTLVRHKS